MCRRAYAPSRAWRNHAKGPRWHRHTREHERKRELVRTNRQQEIVPKPPCVSPHPEATDHTQQVGNSSDSTSFCSTCYYPIRSHRRVQAGHNLCAAVKRGSVVSAFIKPVLSDSQSLAPKKKQRPLISLALGADEENGERTDNKRNKQHPCISFFTVRGAVAAGGSMPRRRIVVYAVANAGCW